ncbi:MAG: hypothetical protein VYD90_10720 [Pseudomonadota bacterium]|nr:hypothetical protein [Pseudomonadota bacterium]
MPETIEIIFCASIVMAVPALGIAIYHTARLEKHLQQSPPDPSSDKGKRP